MCLWRMESTFLKTAEDFRIPMAYRVRRPSSSKRSSSVTSRQRSVYELWRHEQTVSKNGIVKNSFKNTSSRTPASVMGLVVAGKIEEDRNALFYALQRVCELRMIVAYSV